MAIFAIGERFFTKALLAAILLAAAYPYIAGRLWIISVIRANEPSLITEFNNFTEYEVKYQHELKNCEDALIIEGKGSAVLSCDPGRDRWNTVMGVSDNQSSVPSGALYLYRYNERKYPSAHGIFKIELLDFADNLKFHPLGIEYHESGSTLIVANHHFDGPRLEVFTLDIISNPPVARHMRTIIHPLITTPNSIRAISAHEFFVSNDHYFKIQKNRALAKIETYAAIPLGNIVYLDLNNLSASRVLSRIPYPNGITLLNDSTLAVAATSSSHVRLYNISPDKTLSLTETIKVPFMPDNLSTDQKGRLLISGHPHPASLERMVKSRRECLRGQPVDTSVCDAMKVPSWVMEWGVDEGIRTVYRTAGEFGSSSTAVRDSEYGLTLITGLYARGIIAGREKS
ncbi:paraoxonase [Penicillium angulare]|uniref:paraoxonase n=1 Tax=Penicillium angulare TaxID=116970 RepID=UPI002540C1E7|nr:paraoxonase [Penicillium angulare]KAJ5263523.1 paraoxonase [Penicillium angulare]